MSMFLSKSDPILPGEVAKPRADDQMNKLVENTMAGSTPDPGRLGFITSLANEEGRNSYMWFVHRGVPLDWTLLDRDEAKMQGFPEALGPADLSRVPDWISNEDAKKRVPRLFKEPRYRRHSR